jgi:N-acetylglucosaminyldiphosphoundecaprenol N-acetyl-beta-D-mannosaminyltransferase
MGLSSMAPVNILGVNITPITVSELHCYLSTTIADKKRALVLHVNVHGLNLSVKYSWLRKFFNHAELVFCDGAGVMLAARILHSTIPERITFADWTWKLAQHCEQERHSLFFLGARPGVALAAAERLKRKYPALRIVGIQHGYFDKTKNSRDNQLIVQMINALQPDILLVAFGMPLQERWLMENWEKLNVPIGLTGGAVFDYISGNLSRGPHWLTDNGMEWLARLYIEPRRLWRRYVLGNPLFVWRVLQQRIRSGKHSHTNE